MSTPPQVKSQWYYIFWGIMSLAVITGQIYVGQGYRIMAEATLNSSKVCIDLPRRN